MRIFAIILVTAALGTAVGWTAAVVQFRTDVDKPLKLAGGADTHPSSRGEVPRMEVSEPEFNFGTMERDTKKTHTFVVKNVGNAPLTLRVGHTTCKCTLGVASDAPIPPGESTEVRLDWIAKAEPGPFEQTATLLTNDPKNVRFDLVISGEVIEAYALEPHEFLFDKVSAGNSKSASVFVMAMFQSDFTVDQPLFTSAESRDHFDVRIEPVARAELPNAAAKAGVRVTVTVKPGAPLGILHQKLRLHSNLRESPEIEIPFIGRVIGDISIHGEHWNDERSILYIGKVQSAKGSAPERLNILVRGPVAESVKFTLASADPPELKVTIGEPKKLRESLVQVPLEIVVPPDTRPMIRLGTEQGDDGRVILGTTHPTIREIVLGVRFSVER